MAIMGWEDFKEESMTIYALTLEKNPKNMAFCSKGRTTWVFDLWWCAPREEGKEWGRR
mgnify:CR=1 FL=1